MLSTSYLGVAWAINLLSLSLVGLGAEMGTSVASSEELAMSDVSGVREDKIFVSIRLRPLSDIEIARHDLSDWECIDNNTLIFRNSLPERSIFPTSAHTFDRVFECDSSTRKVYEEGAKEVALSVVNGINSSILAYGQTSSGKTYTMCGITAYAVADLYDYIEQQSDREFVMKFSAMEIYNEAVTDLLSPDTAPLRLLDDPERGTVVERLIEDTLRDRNHFEELLHICGAQRKIGETSLNETSSRSHQILRVTVESSARDYFCTENSNILAATVNFVDLAGSERASQTLSAGTRLKEGCHINRSLLTLGTVIRKLSRGRHAHVPYRDSRLTRILQNSLGGNARTAIICTMSPAHSHVEQSRNTLLFASCAKKVSTNAQVNVLTSDKALVKQLKKELAKVESHVRSLESISTSSSSAELLLREKELKIEKMDKEIKEATQEIKEVTQQRDLAQGRVDELLRLVGEDKASRLDEYSVSGESSVIKDRPFQVPEVTDDHFLLDLSTPKFSGPDPCRGWEFIHQRIGEKCLDICKDVECIEEPRLDKTLETDVTLPSLDRKDTKYVIEEPLNEDKTSSPRKEGEEYNLTREVIFCDTPKHELMGMDEDTIASPRKEDNDKPFYDTVKQGTQDTDAETSPRKEDKSSPRKEFLELNNINAECACVALQQKVHNMQKAIKRLVTLTILEPNLCSEANMSICGNIKLGRSRSCARAVTTHSSSLLLAETDKDAIAPPSSHEMEFLLTKSKQPVYQERSRVTVRKEKFCRQDSTNTIVSACLPSEHTKMIEEDVDDLYRGLKEMAKSQPKSQHDDNMRVTDYEDVREDVEEEDGHEDVKKEEDDYKNVKENEEEEDEFADADTSLQPRDDWAMEFQRQRSQIIELWDACYVPLVHRSYFFLLFNGDPSDSIYMEVELRRLSFLVTSLNRNNPTKNSLTPTRASSMKALTREREMLSKQIHKRLERNERESLYKKWGIKLNTKQRSLQMANQIWTDTKEMVKVEESAALVAKLMQVMEPGHRVSKEMFGLSFSAGQALDKRYSSWRSFSNLSEVQFQF